MSKYVHAPLRLLFVLALVVGLLPAAALAQDQQTDIVDTAIAAGDFTTLVAAVQAAGLVDALKGEGPFTVFAPTDAAFAKLPAGTVDSLLADPEGALKQILLYHVVPGKVMSSDLSDGLTAATLQGEDVTFDLDGGPKVNDANIVSPDIETSNGVIHVIDTVILPPSLAAASAEAAPAAEATAEAAAEAVPAADIVDTAVAAGDFSTLVAAVQAAGLVDALKGEGPFTVFAPTDAAFAKLPAGTVDALLADPQGDLTQILLYHVVPGKVMAADVTDGLEATTLQGKPVKFSVQDGKVMINDAAVVAADIETSNGVIHVIDSVILPPADEVVEAAAAAASSEGAAASDSAASSSDMGSSDMGSSDMGSSETAAAPEPQTMPVTGGETSPLLPLAVAGLALVALAGAAFVTRRAA